MVKKIQLPIFVFLVWATLLAAQDLPEDAVQINFDGYFDNAEVSIVYPSVSVSKRINDNTAVRAQYQLDMVSAASMKSSFENVSRSPFSPDGISSASPKNLSPDAVSSASQISPSVTDPDDIRHELIAGVTQIFGQTTISLNGIYSTEHDYDSKTMAVSFSQPFAKKNTVLQLGFVRSWDNITPDIAQMKAASWEKNKDVYSISTGVTQVLSRSLITQLNVSYSNHSGFLSDAYQVVSIVDGNTVKLYNDYHPDSRERKAMGLRANYALFEETSLQLGYRYYWDDWKIRSHTVNASVQHYLSDRQITLGIGIRHYTQTAAYFFKPTYDMAWVNAGNYFTVDSKLNSGYSYEYEVSLKFNGSLFRETPVIGFPFQSDGSQMILGINFYHRHVDSPDWFIRYRNLYAYILTLGFKIPI
ncbi:hypothetical protein Ctha_2108 [Chloroherpeton thalassium ATCC 35110]|uniref:DUF3570 domain-containing protein n=1 Tax=Chloroherpeton thalassium (strain ATCC 35110 / GB-78) TaxID=517418 RepID=B3QVG0_CHLT3|nr:DUF3570 domain-containing protein [Chloroherpeton thalassium]ACF14560.1 hypothetical protein Ctha_2108 [Chloroherpeton thalassium ATCC 35110]